MTRRRKLLTAGGIIAIGLVLAWPFRKGPTNTDASYSPMELPADVQRASNGDPIASYRPESLELSVPVAVEHIAAHVASASSANEPSLTAQKVESFDIANHPALADSHAPTMEGTASLNAPPAPIQPAYSTVTHQLPTNHAWPAELIHIVANGDTLEKLAERYLNDPGRALEIFDLNRDQLNNPHLLPIGVELRVPVNPDRIID